MEPWLLPMLPPPRNGLEGDLRQFEALISHGLMGKAVRETSLRTSRQSKEASKCEHANKPTYYGVLPGGPSQRVFASSVEEITYSLLRRFMKSKDGC